MKISKDESAQHDGSIVRLRIAGALTENLPSLLDLVGPSRREHSIVLDFSALERINSVGLRSLLSECQTLARHFSELEFDKCVPAIVETFNLLPELLALARIRSVLVSEHCPEHLDEHGTKKAPPREIVVGRDVRIVGSQLEVAPAFCLECGRELERADLDEVLFGFLRSSK